MDSVSDRLGDVFHCVRQRLEKTVFIDLALVSWSSPRQSITICKDKHIVTHQTQGQDKDDKRRKGMT